LRNIKLIIEYDGTNYHGWQTQANVSSIQSTINVAVKKITGENIVLIAAGRTDAGVHAMGQTANFHTETKMPADILPLAINGGLPQDIVVKSAEDVSLDFNARKHAVSREYMYIINNSGFRTAVARLYSYHVPLHLDIDSMRKGAEYFKGVHDFSGFMGSGQIRGNKKKVGNGRLLIVDGSRNAPGLSGTHKNIMKLDIERKDDFIYITIKGNSFLIHMVRYMTSALIEIGKGRMKPEKIKSYLEPSHEKWTHSRAPAKGLFLMKVDY